MKASIVMDKAIVRIIAETGSRLENR